MTRGAKVFAFYKATSALLGVLIGAEGSFGFMPKAPLTRAEWERRNRGEARYGEETSAEWSGDASAYCHAMRTAATEDRRQFFAAMKDGCELMAWAAAAGGDRAARESAVDCLVAAAQQGFYALTIASPELALELLLSFNNFGAEFPEFGVKISAMQKVAEMRLEFLNSLVAQKAAREAAVPHWWRHD